MKTFSALLAICEGNSPVSGEFPAQRPVRRSFDVFFDLRPNKRLNRLSWGWWFETPSHPLWRHCTGYPHKSQQCGKSFHFMTSLWHYSEVFNWLMLTHWSWFCFTVTHRGNSMKDSMDFRNSRMGSSFWGNLQSRTYGNCMDQLAYGAAQAT